MASPHCTEEPSVFNFPHQHLPNVKLRAGNAPLAVEPILKRRQQGLPPWRDALWTGAGHRRWQPLAQWEHTRLWLPVTAAEILTDRDF